MNSFNAIFSTSIAIQEPIGSIVTSYIATYGSINECFRWNKEHINSVT